LTRWVYRLYPSSENVITRKQLLRFEEHWHAFTAVSIIDVYTVSLFRTDVSENELSPFPEVLRLIGSHSCITVETLLLSVSIEGRY
jgi:hypothetical protein